MKDNYKSGLAALGLATFIFGLGAIVGKCAGSKSMYEGFRQGTVYIKDVNGDNNPDLTIFNGSQNYPNTNLIFLRDENGEYISISEFEEKSKEDLKTKIDVIEKSSLNARIQDKK